MISLIKFHWLVTSLCSNYIFGILKSNNILLVDLSQTYTINKFLNTGLLSEIYKNELDKVCFQHDMVYKYKYLKGRAQFDIVLKNKAYKIATNPRVGGFQRALASMIWKFFNERSRIVLGSGIANKKLADELQKSIIKKFERRKVYSSFKDNIWGFDLAGMILISKFNKRMKYLLCVIDVL